MCEAASGRSRCADRDAANLDLTRCINTLPCISPQIYRGCETRLRGRALPGQRRGVGGSKRACVRGRERVCGMRKQPNRGGGEALEVHEAACGDTALSSVERIRDAASRVRVSSWSTRRPAATRRRRGRTDAATPPRASASSAPAGPGTQAEARISESHTDPRSESRAEAESGTQPRPTSESADPPGDCAQGRHGRAPPPTHTHPNPPASPHPHLGSSAPSVPPPGPSSHPHPPPD